MTEAEVLRQVDLFNGLSNDQLERLAGLARELTMVRGQIIVEEKTTGDELYVIAEGQVEVVLGVDSAIPHIGNTGPLVVSRLGVGQVFGEMALLDKGPRSATVRCVSDTTRLLVVRRDDLFHLAELDSRFGYVLMRNMAVDLAFKLRSRNLARM